MQSDDDKSERFRLERETLLEFGEIKGSLARLTSVTATMEEQIKTLVTRQEFLPVKYLVYSFVGALMSGIVAALLALVLRR